MISEAMRRGVPEPLAELCTLDKYDPALQDTEAGVRSARRALNAVEDWVKGYAPPMLLLVGAVGIGKTHLLVAATMAFKHIDPRREPAHYITAADFDARCKNFQDAPREARTGESYWVHPDDYVRRLCEFPGALAIDDLGAGYIDKGWTLTRFERLIDARYLARRPTLLSSNLDSSEFKDAVGARVYDRFRDAEVSRIVSMGGAESVRPKSRSAVFRH